MGTIQESFILFEDTETTGKVPGKDEPSEIASILTDLKNREIARYHKKIRLQDPMLMTAEAAAINGYDPAVWAKEAVPFFDYDHWLQKHIPFGHVAIPIGHNPKFDRDIIDLKHYKPYGKFFKWALRCVDTAAFALALRLRGILKVPDVKLATVSRALGFPAQTHRAMDDCEASKKIFELVCDALDQSTAPWVKTAREAPPLEEESIFA